jgi:hypothetical protein
MPLTSFQSEILRTLAKNRSPESHLAGGSVINRSEDSPRFSQDMDIFHDREELVEKAWTSDKEVLQKHGFVCSLMVAGNDRAFFRALVERGGMTTLLDWAYDSAFRFFPVEEDPLFGWRLNDTDLAIDKALALAGRSASRDIVDILFLEKRGFPLGALIWAIPAKDPGYSPEFALEMMRANAKVPDKNELSLREEADGLSPLQIKKEWLSLANKTEEQLTSARKADILPGLIFLHRTPDSILKKPVWGTSLFANPENFASHKASQGGVWPRFVQEASKPPSLPPPPANIGEA